jgi:Ca-activated chloride channel family protein
VLAPAIQTAYRYGEADRTLNVVVLSDGMTEQGERQQLMALINSRPANARVFCIGIGNEVNRRLLNQMAEDTGGLAAFISRGDNFQRQAQAFRRKLMRPVATDLELDIQGVEITDMEPARLPNLYHGAPVRIYGRYTGSGEARVRLSATVQGQEIDQSATMVFAKAEDGNPEIERMWAWKRIDSLLKKADRQGSRAAVADEIIRLGEAYSIVTEYTSFLVLENDGEYQRWKIERRNRSRMARDRAAQTERAERLAAIRDRAVADLGPQPVLAANSATPGKTAGRPTTRQAPTASRPASQPAPPQPDPPRNQGFDLNMGSGPVGPLFVGLAAWLKRRKKKR